MGRVVPSVGLLAAMAVMLSSCASSNSADGAAAPGSAIAASSPIAGSASTVRVSSPLPACPPVAGWPSGSSAAAPAGQVFVADSPTLATLCQYVQYTVDGSSAPPPVLVQISGAALPKLITSLNALVPTNDEPPCPAPKQADVLVFVGAGSSSTVLAELQGGCEFVWSNTGLHAYATKELTQQLAAIVVNAPGSDAPATSTSS